MDEYEAELIRVVELSLQNPKTGTPAARELSMLVEKTREYEARIYPMAMHPRTGQACACAIHCARGCECWCHSESAAL